VEALLFTFPRKNLELMFGGESGGEEDGGSEREIPNKKDALAYLGEEMPNILPAGKKWSPSFTDDSCGVTVGRHDGSSHVPPALFQRTYS
ncbi:hypothetical protein AVEN_205474-1, partial [Araneus ventricosus]